jgi:energy-coupling factor transporter ATP-binding protein EcfA2
MNVRFVDREIETKRIIDDSEKTIFGGMINILYGPKGCGKTTFFKALKFASESQDVNIDVLYISREYEETPELVKLYMPKRFNQILKEIASAIGGSVEISYEGSGVISASFASFRVVRTAVESIVKGVKGGRKIIIVVDEVRADSDESLSKLRGWLETFANDLGYMNLDYKNKTGGSITVITLVSDALIAEIRHIVGAKVAWSLMWNLSREAMKELAEELNLDIETDTLWRLTGGNPRALQTIAIYGLEKWFKEEILKDLRDLYRDLLDIFRDRDVVWRELEQVLQNIDQSPASMLRSMLRRNIIIYIGAASSLSKIPVNEPWIMEDFAYQMPAFYHTLKIMISRRSIDVALKDVLANL